MQKAEIDLMYCSAEKICFLFVIFENEILMMLDKAEQTCLIDAVQVTDVSFIDFIIADLIKAILYFQKITTLHESGSLLKIMNVRIGTLLIVQLT